MQGLAVQVAFTDSKLIDKLILNYYVYASHAAILNALFMHSDKNADIHWTDLLIKVNPCKETSKM